MKCRCLGFEVLEEESRRSGGSGIARGARTGCRCRKMGTVVTGVTPTVVSKTSQFKAILD